MTYASLHNHTEYSNLRLIDSINRSEELIDYAYELGLAAVAITDHESVSAHQKAIDYYEANYKDKENFKLILGNEIYLTNDGLNASNATSADFNHFILLAKDLEGHRQLRELSSRAWKRSWKKGIQRTPTYLSDLYDIVEPNPGHLVATTACIGGYPGRTLSNLDFIGEEAVNEKIDSFLAAMQSLFGKGNFYIELQPSSSSEDQIFYNKWMLNRYWGLYDFTIATDSHYLKKEDREIHKWFLNSKDGEREVDEFYASAYMMSPEEVESYFKPYLDMDRLHIMFQNTLNIANMCSSYNLAQDQTVVKIKYDENMKDYRDFIHDYNKYEFINYYATTSNKADAYFYNLICRGLSQKWKDSWDYDVYVSRIDEELRAIYKISEKMNKSLSDYFTSMAKMIDIIWNEAESFVGPSRGSAGCFLINYLIGITQMNPLEQELPLHSWRFLHEGRPELPDIDFDTESTRRVKVFNKLQEYFTSIGGDVITVCTFGTEKTKAAIKTAARGLDIPDEVVAYVTSMIPNERGFDWTLKQCYYGDDSHAPIARFKEEMDKYPMLWQVASKIEGLVVQLGCHASGIIAINGNFIDNNSFMKTGKGQLVSAYDLHDTEKLGLVKYDMLTVSALDRIHQAFNYLLEDGQIEWCGNLRATYNRYLSPEVLNYDNEEMWDKVSNMEINSLFQFDTITGIQAIKKIRPRSLKELAISSSVMRLMGEGKLPLEIYADYKHNIHLWYQELMMYKLTNDEVKLLEKHLLKLSGVADSQEAIMLLSMDPQISNFSMQEANKLRKVIAKKKFKEIEIVKHSFYEKGEECGASKNLLDYVWNVQVSRQLGYSFSWVHTTGYALIALQEMNLAYFYPIIYWNCACLSVDASAVNEEDFDNLITDGVMELSDEEDKRDQNKISYTKMAKSITNFKRFTTIKLPDINKSKLGFTPNVETNSILYGLKGIATITAPTIQEINEKRPFTSLSDFIQKTTKKVVNKGKIINLIKCGAFNDLENDTSENILKRYLSSTADMKTKLNMQNARKLLSYNLIPKEQFKKEILGYLLTIEFRKHRDSNKMYYIVSEALVPEDQVDESIQMINNNATTKHLLLDGEEKTVIDSNVWDNNVYNPCCSVLKNFIARNEKTLLQQLNDRLFEEEWNNYVEGGVQNFELDSLSFYYTKHPLENVIKQLPVEVTTLDNMVEDAIDGFFMIKGQQVPKMKLYHMAGIVIDKDKTNGMATIQTPEGVIEIKLYKDLFALYNQSLMGTDENGNVYVQDESFFEKGTSLLVTGVLRGTTFIPKVYKSTNLKPIMKIILDENNNYLGLQEKMS